MFELVVSRSSSPLPSAERAILKETGSTVVLDALEMDTERAWTTLGTRSVFARGVHVRTRHVDAVLAESLRPGATQVVILGAGLDSRAYRLGDALRGVRVFELGLPQTQTYNFVFGMPGDNAAAFISARGFGQIGFWQRGTGAEVFAEGVRHVLVNVSLPRSVRTLF